MSPGRPGPLLVVGAHLDDAVLSCGRWLAACPGSVVCTAFAGRPDPARGHAVPGTTVWDAACGFAPGQDVLAVRHAEDDAALRLLRARGVRLPFVDAQYAPAPPAGEVAAALRRVLDEVRPRQVLLPLGLLHRDHRTLAAAWVRLAAGADVTGWGVYEDVPYRGFVPVRHRLAALARAGVRLGPALPVEAGTGPEPVRRAAAAVAAYRSQAAGLATLAARARDAVRDDAGTDAGTDAGDDGGTVVRWLLPAGVRAGASPRPSRGPAARPA